MISIVIPVYNTAQYLPACIDSIIQQSYKDFEMILVDDGSTDDSPELCDQYAAQYPFVTALHYENHGPSFARNKGTEAAKGDYILYIDSDDLIVPGHLQSMIDTAEKFRAGMVLGSFSYLSGSLNESKNLPVADPYTLSGMEALEEMLSGRLFGASACNILLNASLAKSISFPEGKFHEDDLTSYKYYLHTETVAIQPAGIYYYRQHGASIMHRAFGPTVIDELDAADHITEDLIKTNSALEKASQIKQFENYLQVFLQYPDIKTSAPDTYQRVIRQLCALRSEILQNTKAPKRLRLQAFLLCVGGPGLLKLVKGRS